MSESSKMGLTGSKDHLSSETSYVSDIPNEEESFSTHLNTDDSKTLDVEILNATGIADMSVQSEPVNDSTFESEIDALSRIIRDSKGESNKNIKECDFQEINSVQQPFVDEEHSQKEDREKAKKSEQLVKEIIRSENCLTFGVESNNTFSIIASSTLSENTSSSAVDQTKIEKSINDASSLTNISKSLQMIGEAYISEDSQGSNEYSENPQQPIMKEVSVVKYESNSPVLRRNNVDNDNVNPPDIHSEGSQQDLQFHEFAKNRDTFNCDKDDQVEGGYNRNKETLAEVQNDVVKKLSENLKLMTSLKGIMLDESRKQNLNNDTEGCIGSKSSAEIDDSEIYLLKENMDAGTDKFTQKLSTLDCQSTSEKLIRFEIPSDSIDLKVIIAKEPTSKSIDKNSSTAEKNQNLKLGCNDFFNEETSFNGVQDPSENNEKRKELKGIIFTQNLNFPEKKNLSPLCIESENDTLIDKVKDSTFELQDPVIKAFLGNFTTRASKVGDETLNARSTKVFKCSLDRGEEKGEILEVNNDKLYEKTVAEELSNMNFLDENADQRMIVEKGGVANDTEDVEENGNSNILESETNGLSQEKNFCIKAKDDVPIDIDLSSINMPEKNIQKDSTNVFQLVQNKKSITNNQSHENQEVLVTIFNSEECTENEIKDTFIDSDNFFPKGETAALTALESPQGEEKLEEMIKTDRVPSTSFFEELLNSDSIPSSGKSAEEAVNKSNELDTESNVVASRIPDVSNLNPEISELESAVKFLQESEEQMIDSPLGLSSKIVENDIDDQASVSESHLCESSEIDIDDIELMNGDSIAISEAEIISEAAKLESERKAKLAETVAQPFKLGVEVPENASSLLTITKYIRPEEFPETSNYDSPDYVSSALGVNVLMSTESIPKMSVLEERLKEPPKIIIPNVDVVKMCDTKMSLLIQKDAKFNTFQKIIESPKAYDKIDTPRKDSEKADLENVGSPRIILKIAKSAIADSGELKSPKSPKIRSATNSPNPEDSPGQKLGKIKLKLSKSGHPSIISYENFEESLEWHTESTPSLSPIGMKIKLSKSGEASVVQSEKAEDSEDKERQRKSDDVKKLESSIGMKFKLSKSGDASIITDTKVDSPIGMKIKLLKIKDSSIIQAEKQCLLDEAVQDGIKKTESPLGMKIKLSKRGEASIVSSEYSGELTDELNLTEKNDTLTEISKHSESPVGMKIRLSKTKGGTSVVLVDNTDEGVSKMGNSDIQKQTESPLGMKIKLSKTGDASIIHQGNPNESELTKHSDPMLGMKIKVSKTGEATIIQSERSDNLDEFESNEYHPETKKSGSSIGMKIKLSKSGDVSFVQTEVSTESEEKIQDKHLRTKDLFMADVEKKEKQQKSKDASKKPEEPSLEMKIKLSKTGHPTIVSCESLIDSSNAELTIKPVYSYIQKTEFSKEISYKRKEVTIPLSESKRAKLESKLPKIFSEVTIQPVTSKEKKQALLDPKSNISHEQMHVLNREISIMQVKLEEKSDPGCSNVTTVEKTSGPLNEIIHASSGTSDCEIIEHRPELVIVNENSNSSQDVVIIEEVSSIRLSDVKIPKKRGRPRRNISNTRFVEPVRRILPRDPLALDEASLSLQEPKENERPRRTCRSQRSYAPPKRGRGGRGRGKRKLDVVEMSPPKKSKIHQDLTAIEKSTLNVIKINESPRKAIKPKELCEFNKTSNISFMYEKSYKSGKKLLTEKKRSVDPNTGANIILKENHEMEHQHVELTGISKMLISTPLAHIENDSVGSSDNPEKIVDLVSGRKIVILTDNEKVSGHQNWLTPSSKKVSDSSFRSECISSAHVIDEETRMSAESGSRSHTPARNLSAPASETVINEESQGSVQSTATTESEKVKVKNRRMEINFDPDEGPFTVDKIAEYEWPFDRKGETFMIQEQISQYLGVKSFKRKYPDLKRRIVDMEERNYLRDNGLVSESMCDMGLTAVCSSEVLDVMCSDFPDQYEEYRKHMREKQVKEHSKKQKELTAAATAERNRIDLAEMAVQSALSWNTNLNKARMDARTSSLDLQTFTIHMPKKEQKFEIERNVSHYPVALIPGQYTDYYREYTPAELRYYPLNTVLYGPMKPNERKFDSQSEGSQSDSDSDSSSDDSSSSSSDGTQGTEASRSTVDDADMELVMQKSDMKIVKYML